MKLLGKSEIVEAVLIAALSAVAVACVTESVNCAKEKAAQKTKRKGKKKP